jgi:hypothetical protein
MPNMVAFFNALHHALPDAAPFALSARTPAMRNDTLAWLHRHGVGIGDAAVCFVPAAEAKVRVWHELARDGALVIVDDLRYGHEGDELRLYQDLVDSARTTASAYVGAREITEIAENAEAVDAIVARIVESLAK